MLDFRKYRCTMLYGMGKQKGKTMKQIIVSMENCQKCETLKAIVPDAECVVVQPAEILQFAKLVGIQSMPFVVITGEPHELANKIKG